MKRIVYILWIILIIPIILSNNITYADEIDNEKLDTNFIKEEIIQTSGNIIDEPKINSRAAVVIDRNSKTVLYDKKMNEKREMASTTKIMTAIVTLENGNLKDVVTISRKAAGTGGSRLGIKYGDKITLHDLMYGLLLCSGNDAAVAIAEHIGGSVEGFADLMNKKAKEMGLTNSHFITPHGLDKDEHYTTAYELALMADYALKIPKFKEIVMTNAYSVTINGYPKTIKNTNELLGNLDGVYGVKTGFTNKAGRCLVTATKRGNLDLICVVLGADTKKIRTTDSIKLIEYCFENFELVNIKDIIESEFEDWLQNNFNGIEIIKGVSETPVLTLENNSIGTMPIKKEEIKNIKVNIETVSTIFAPLHIGDKLGNLTVCINNKELYDVRIISKNEIRKKEVMDYFTEMLSNYVIYLNDTIMF